MSALQNLRLSEGIAMEKSWENFWTTGKVEDYLSYRNSVAEKEEKSQTSVGEGQETQKNKQTWKGF